jgi:4-amino-4-deoxy-L-arabinose transferase-like glycosyltransferase
LEKTSNKNYIYLLIIFILSIIGSLFITWCMRKGPWGWSDSVAYLVTARNLIKGIWFGYYFPDGSFYNQIIQAPIYPIVLALIGTLNIDLISGARVLNIFLFGGTIFFTGLTFIHYTNNPWLSVISCIAVGSFPIFIYASTGVMTESLFVFLYFLGLYLLIGYLKQKRFGLLISSGIIIGLLPVTRYIGIAVILTCIITILLFSTTNWRLRLKAALIFGLLSLIPITIWGLWIINVTNGIPNVTISGITWSQVIIRFAEFRASTIQLVWKWIPLHDYLIGLKFRYQYLVIIAIFITVILISYFTKHGWLQTAPPPRRTGVSG